MGCDALTRGIIICIYIKKTFWETFKKKLNFGHHALWYSGTIACDGVGTSTLGPTRRPLWRTLEMEMADDGLIRSIIR